MKTLEMLQRETDAAIEAIAAIKDQIARAKSRAANTGDYSDADWFLNAVLASALRVVILGPQR